MTDLKTTLAALIEGDVADDTATLQQDSKDTSIFQVQPSLVVYPKHTKDVQALVRYANEHPDELTLTARSAGTCMTGGPLTKSVVVSFTEHFNRIIEVGEDYAVVEPGVYYRDFEPETLKKDLILPCYTASRELNTVGGMVANNSGGEKSLTYGKTERYIRSLKVVLRDGNVYEIKKLSRAEFDAKKDQSNFEGEFYRSLGALIE